MKVGICFVKNFILCDPILNTSVFLFQTFILLKSRFEGRTDTIDRLYIIHGKVSEGSTLFFCSHTFSNNKKPIKSKLCSDWLNWWIVPSDWLVKI